MGFIIKADLETSLGPSKEVYVRIESITYNKGANLAMFQITYWIDKDHATKTNRTFIDEPLKNMIGLIFDKVVYYVEGDSEGVEVVLPQYIEHQAVVEKEVEIPILETKIKTKEVPYVSFDEEGEEITLYKTISIEEEVEVGKKVELKKVIDHSVPGRLLEYCYEVLKQELATRFPIDNIETV